MGYHRAPMKRSDFKYHLPTELIAQQPLSERRDSRLLCMPADGQISDQQFTDLPRWLAPGDLLVINNTRVIPARLFGNKASGGKLELMIERLLGSHRAYAQIRCSRSPKVGSLIDLAEGFQAEVLGRDDDLFELGFSAPLDELLNQIGQLPLPPYIERDPDRFDAERYQTVFGTIDGAVAAPTAGLHFDAALLAELKQMGVDHAEVTLHVGAGTFQPVRVEQLADHKMHSEWLSVSQQVVDQVAATRQAGGRVIAVGTTSVRALESASQSGALLAFEGDTKLFITPGYRFRSVDGLITNFHLPESTLLMLVSAFSGYAQMKAAYQHAIAQAYRFFSYGDAMFLLRNDQA